VTTAETEALIQKYMPTIHHLMYRLHVPIQEQEDIIQAGIVGLLEAAQKDRTGNQGTGFARYAHLRIFSEMVEYIRISTWKTRGVCRQTRQHEKAVQQLENLLCRPGTIEEKAAFLGIPLADYLRQERENDKEIRMQEAAIFYSTTSSEDPANIVELKSSLQRLQQILRMLPPDQRTLIDALFFQGKPGKQVALEMGLNETRISQKRRALFASLRKNFTNTLKRTVT
jgi:RNA polymerase sigma factor FliA